MTPGAPSPSPLLNTWHRLGLAWWEFWLLLLNRVTVVGAEHIPPRGSSHVMLCANHISAVDPFLIGVVAMPRWSPVWWRAPAKAELFDRPVVGSVLRSWGAFPVWRGQQDYAAMERMVRLLPSSVIVIFPEGTWSTTGELLPGRPGVGKIIHDAQPTVIPVAVSGTDRVLPRGRTLPRIGQRTTVAFGPPLDLKRFYTQPNSPELSQRIVDAVMMAIGDLYQAIRAT